MLQFCTNNESAIPYMSYSLTVLFPKCAMPLLTAVSIDAPTVYQVCTNDASVLYLNHQIVDKVSETATIPPCFAQLHLFNHHQVSGLSEH